MGESEHNDHLDDWADRFETTESKTFVRDGDLDHYWDADTRICTVLKETNEPVVCDDLRTHHMKKLEGKLRCDDSIFRLGVWAAVLRRRCSTYEECRQEGLVRKIGRQLAVVNLKKTSGGPKAESSELHAFASTYRRDLKEQIRLLDPEIVLACGKSVDLILMWLFRLEWRDEPMDGEKNLRWAVQGERIYVTLVHPSAPGAVKKEFERLTRAWPQIQSEL